MLPELFVDRSVGRVAVPEFFRSVWPSPVQTLDDVFGLGKVEDAEWMQRVDAEGWVAVCKDDRIRTRPGERQLMSRGNLRVFCLANGNLVTAAQVARFEANLDAIKAQAPEPGPWLFAVYTSEITSMKLYS